MVPSFWAGFSPCSGSHLCPPSRRVLRARSNAAYPRQDLKTRAGGGHAHDGLIRFHLDDFLVRADGISRLDVNLHDAGFGDGLAELRHEDGDAGHWPVGSE